MSKSTVTSYVTLALVVVVVIVLILLVPAKSNKATKTNVLSAQQKTADTKDINNNVVTFFAANTSLKERENLLQNGSKFAQPMEAEFSQLDQEKPSVTINKVTFINNTTATVNYTVKLNNQPVLKDQNGQALYIDNTWKLSDSTLCNLLSMGGSTPSICSNAKS